uniref:Uncharacterized protein n=1 Tax=Wuchereria bancrofti TaxID=6293 RepID=A0AAF5Q490_WUCBA
MKKQGKTFFLAKSSCRLRKRTSAQKQASATSFIKTGSITRGRHVRKAEI